MKGLFQHFPIPVAFTLFIWLLIGWYLGFSAFVTVIILTFLEISLSVDNAVVNSRVLVQMSQFWQRLFMTLGIFIAVFVIRFALPIIIVAASASLGAGDVLDLALNHPEEYGHKLHDAAPMINAFGGIFLIMVGIYFFLDRSRANFWLKPERIAAGLGKRWFIKPLIIIALALAVYASVQPAEKDIVGVSLLIALAIYWLLHGVTLGMEKLHESNTTALKKTGFQAFTAFLYLEVLDASFSLDGVIGAFAITDNIFIIMGGLGVGAIWVRAITLHLVKSGTLIRYKFLESGAHWAILLLGVIMLVKLFGIEPPEWLIGSVGLTFIALSVIASNRLIKRQKEARA